MGRVGECTTHNYYSIEVGMNKFAIVGLLIVLIILWPILLVVALFKKETPAESWEMHRMFGS
jgi:hypothetical protein